MFNRCPFCKSLNISIDLSGKFECSDCRRGSDNNRIKRDDYLQDNSPYNTPNISGMVDGDDTFIPVNKKTT